MKKQFLFSLFLLGAQAYAQKTPTEMAQPNVEEGKRLYRSEMASWYGTDVFLAKYSDQANIGGYFSYVVQDTARCIFYSKEQTPKVIGDILFTNGNYNPDAAVLNLNVRDLTAEELAYYSIKKVAQEMIRTDTFFRHYEKTSMNLIPLVTDTERKVYAVTASAENGILYLGNDYLVLFDAGNQVISKKRLHQSLLSFNYGKKTENEKEVQQTGAMHTHLPETGPFMTATDICTLMLYAKLTGWQQHNVVTKEYFNIWTCASETLTVITMDALHKIDKDQEKRKKERNKNKDKE